MAGNHRLDLLARLQHRHRGCRRRSDQIGIKDVEHAAREARAFRIDLQPGARGKEGNAVQQPLDIGVGAGHRIQRKIARHRRMHVGEFRRERADMGQFLLVIFYEDPIHLRLP